VSLVLLLPMLIPALITKLPHAMRGSLQEMLVSGRLTPMELVFALLIVLDVAVIFAAMRRFRRPRLIAAA
jgi:ABC-type transport system involved in cytochrome c biogenesis permease component